jgi:hypothetical protein
VGGLFDVSFFDRMRRSAQAEVASDSDREALGKSRGAEKKKSELEDLNWKFLKTDVAAQEVGPRYLARGLEQCHRLAGWLA